MSTGELDRLERVERLLENALHEADRVAVDLPGGRAALAPQLDEQRQRSVRRRTIIAVAASLLAVIVTASIVLAGLGDHEESLPVAPSPGITLSPSGLPVGLLVGEVDRTEVGAVSTVRMVVRADGTGTWNARTVGDGTADSVAAHEVEFVGNGPGRAVIRQDLNSCSSPDALTLEFTVRGRTVLIHGARTNICLVNLGLASDMTGTTMHVLPLPPGP